MIISALNYQIYDMRKYVKDHNLTEKFVNFMVDIETTGTSPDLNMVVEVCIVPFHLIQGALIVSDPEYHIKFKLNDQQGHRNWDDQTIIWWEKQSKEVADSVFSHFLDESINNKNVLIQMAIMISSMAANEAKFWSKPNSFDFMFMQSIFKQYAVIFPFKYHKAKCMAGFCTGVAYVNHKTDDHKIYEPLERHGAHDSMNDCYYQLEWLQNAVADDVIRPIEPTELPF